MGFSALLLVVVVLIISMPFRRRLPPCLQSCLYSQVLAYARLVAFVARLKRLFLPEITKARSRSRLFSASRRRFCRHPAGDSRACLSCASFPALVSELFALGCQFVQSPAVVADPASLRALQVAGDSRALQDFIAIRRAWYGLPCALLAMAVMAYSRPRSSPGRRNT